MSEQPPGLLEEYLDSACPTLPPQVALWASSLPIWDDRRAWGRRGTGLNGITTASNDLKLHMTP
jgi:hypothetical protein